MTTNPYLQRFNKYTKLNAPNAAYPAKYAAELAESGNKAQLSQLLDYFENHVFQNSSIAADFWSNMFIMPLYTDSTPTGKQLYTHSGTGEYIRTLMGKNCLKIWQYASDYYARAALIHEQIRSELPHKYDPENKGLPYLDAWNIAEHIADSFLSGNIHETQKWLCLADELCAEENVFLNTLGQAGYIEDLQNIFISRGGNAAHEKQLCELMGKAAQNAWLEIKKT